MLLRQVHINSTILQFCTLHRTQALFMLIVGHIKGFIIATGIVIKESHQNGLYLLLYCVLFIIGMCCIQDPNLRLIHYIWYMNIYD